MNYEKIIRQLVDLKFEQDNQIDLHAYELGMRALAKQLTLTDVSQKRELLIAYEKNHYTPIEWSQVSKQCIEDINKFLAINCG